MRDANVEAGRSLQFPLSESCDVRILFTGQVTKEDIDTVREHLDLSKKSFPSQVDLKASSQPSQPDPEPRPLEEEQ